MSDLRDRAIQIYDAFTHEHRDRRTLLRQMAVLAGSVAAAETLIAGIAASPAAAAITQPDDKRLKTRKGAHILPDGKNINGYFAVRADLAHKAGAVMVIHENRGLNAHIEDITRRIALEGFLAFAPDFLSDQGGTPADENAARDLIAKVDYDSIVAEALGVIGMLKRIGGANGKVGTVGFCWGGGLVDRVAVAAGGALAAAVPYYGPAPEPAEAVKVKAAMLLHYAGKDTRVNSTGAPWAAALEAAGKDVQAYTYEGVDHAFNNDTSVERYNAPAATLAWQRTIAFFHAHLDT
ncbi:dienelactone hydrolase family protein [Sphingomonas oligophenolica]|uniref:Dienelactone hydrolase family protein n=1 Tax=Sphingomonas oligophenolica TaxID=301154 RepID=A0ABU9XZU9_9SPHN